LRQPPGYNPYTTDTPPGGYLRQEDGDKKMTTKNKFLFRRNLFSYLSKSYVLYNNWKDKKFHLTVHRERKEYKGEPLPEKIPWEGEFTLRSDP
jgi:hypothetical protein